MTALTIAEQIAAVKETIEELETDPLLHHEQAGPVIDLRIARLRAVLATLEAQPAMLAVIEAARKLVWWKIGDKPQAQRWAELQHALAALPLAPEETP